MCSRQGHAILRAGSEKQIPIRYPARLPGLPRNLEGVVVIGIFAKVLQGEPIKTRLQTKLSRTEAERFYLASLADTLETTAEIEPNPTLFLQGGANVTAVEHLHAQLLERGLDAKIWERLRLAPQTGRDLGHKLENAFESLFRYATRGSCALIVGSDSPSLDTGKLRRGLLYLLEEAEDGSRPDMVLGPTTDGGYWAIGLRRLMPGLLEDIAWSTDRTLRDTQRRAHHHAGLCDRAAGLHELRQPEVA